MDYFFSRRSAIALDYSWLRRLLLRLLWLLLGRLLLGRELRWLWLTGRPLSGKLHAWDEA